MGKDATRFKCTNPDCANKTALFKKHNGTEVLPKCYLCNAEMQAKDSRVGRVKTQQFRIN